MAKRGINTTSKRNSELPANTDISTDRLPFPQTSSFKLIRPGIGLFRRNLEASLVIMIIPALLIQLGAILADENVISARVALGTLITLVAGIWLIINTSVNYYFQLRIVGGDRPGILECYKEGIRFLPRLIGLAMLSGLAIVIGTLLFVVPGLIAFRRYVLAPYFLVDGDIGIREAMRRSAAASKPVSGYIWSSISILAVFAIAGWLLGRYIPTYGGTIAILLTGLYIFIPALRYQEVALRRSALAVKN